VDDVSATGSFSPGAVPRTAAIVGLGLIGGSLALRLRAVGARITGIDIDPRALAAARARGAIDEASDSLAAAAGADLVILATPIERIVDRAVALAPHLRPDAVLTDTGSVKAPLVAAVEAALPGVRFIGGHPIAGSEGRGFAAADPGLLDGRPFVLTPTGRTPPGAISMMRQVIVRIGMRPVELDPVQHDELAAQISHLPYLVSVALRRAAADDALAIAGRGFADMTRIARSPAPMWTAVCRANRAAILRALATFQEEVARLRRALEADRIGDALPPDADAAPISSGPRGDR
jgi:prephenate dehydrogenase